MSEVKSQEWQEVSGEFSKSIRWTQEPSGPWEKENSEFVGEEIHGILDDIRTNIGQNNVNIYEVFTALHGLVSVWDTTVLSDKMKKVMTGEEVKITYNGLQTPKTGGKAYKTFTILHRSPDADLTKVIDGLRTKKTEETSTATEPVEEATEGMKVEDMFPKS